MKKEDHIIPHLTVVDKHIEEVRSKTPPGMAHWSGTGPLNTTCRECNFYEFNGYKSNRGSFRGGTLKNGICKKFEIMMRREGPKIPFETPSCKYFDLNKKPPTIVDPRNN